MYMKSILKRKSIGKKRHLYFDPYDIESKWVCKDKCVKKCSEMAATILDKLEIELGVHIQHHRYQGKEEEKEFKPIDKRKFSVDGYIHESKTIFEIFGDQYHGHPGLGEGGIREKKWYTLFIDTEKRLKTLTEYGYTNIYYIWIGEMNKDKPLFKQFIKFDGKLKTRFKWTTILNKGIIVKIDRAGDRSPLKWGEKSEEYVKYFDGKEIRLPKLSYDGLYEWYDA